jgi:hypothetical protein
MRTLCLVLALLLNIPAAAQQASKKKPAAKKPAAAKQVAHKKPTAEQIRRFNELQKTR